MRSQLPGVVVVTAADTAVGAAHAHALDGDATALVLCGTDAAALGTLASELSSRVAVFVGDPLRDRAALVELVREVFARERE